MTCVRGSGRRGRVGFTIVEMLTAITVGSVMLLGALQVVMTQTRLHTVQAATTEVKSNLRAAASLLVDAFLELSPTEGDVMAVGSETVTIRAARGAGVICSWKSISGSHWYGFSSVSGEFEVGDSVFTYGVDSNSWATAAIQDIETGTDATTKIPACFYGDSTTATAPAIKVALNFSGITDTLMVGAPVRSFEHTTFALVNQGSVAWLTRKLAGDSARALAGPLLPDSGLEFTYRDAQGDTTSVAAEVDQVGILLRGMSSRKISGGRGHAIDSLRVTVKIRNN